MKIENYMKTRIFVGLSLVLVASFISACASKTPKPAAASAALEQKSSGLDHSQAQPSSDSNSRLAHQPGESVTGTTDTAPATVAPAVETSSDTTPTQAAALAALQQKFYELDHPETQASTDANSMARVSAQPAESATHATGAATTTGVTQPTALAATPATEAPAATASSEAPTSAVSTAEVQTDTASA